MNARRLARILSIPILVLGFAQAAHTAPEVKPPRVVLQGVPFSLTVSDPDLSPNQGLPVRVTLGEDTRAVALRGPDPVTIEDLHVSGQEGVILSSAAGESTTDLRILPGWTSIAPPLLAILLAVVFRQAVLALFLGVWLGAWLVFGNGLMGSFFQAVETFILDALTDRYNMILLLFTFAMGGMLGIIGRSGGTQGIVSLVAPLARTARSGQVATWFMGLVIFFDDYANTLMVGNTMRPVTDRLRISREKLSYIVDSTAAPVASLAIVSTWIGVEVGLIGEALNASGIERDAFGAFLASLPYRFYQIFALVFVLMVAVSGRDFGPMLKAEKRARATGKTLRPGSHPLANYETADLRPRPGTPRRWWNAAIPVAVLVGWVVWSLYDTGRTAALEAGEPLGFKSILGNADSYLALLWASFLASAVAFVLAVGQRTLSLAEAVTAWVEGAKSVYLAAIILTLAWAISDVASALGTASYLVQTLEGSLDPRFVPTMVFVLAGATAFATGSSWSTMGILTPLVIPLVHSLDPGNEVVLVNTIASVLAGAVWGDHCSPISDTTVLSSMASSVDHMDHVNTQLPYAFVVGVVAVVLGGLPIAFGLPFWVSWAAGIAVMAAVLLLLGKRSDQLTQGRS